MFSLHTKQENIKPVSHVTPEKKRKEKKNEPNLQLGVIEPEIELRQGAWEFVNTRVRRVLFSTNISKDIFLGLYRSSIWTDK